MPAVHAFAVADGRPVGHCAVVPMRARLGDEPFHCGKVEALFLEAPYRGRPPGGAEPVALRLRTRLYAAAEENGIELLHAYVRPEVGRVLGLEPLHVGERSRVAVVRPRALSTTRLRAQGTGLAAAQSVVREATYAAGRVVAGTRNPGTLRALTGADVDLATAPPPAPGRWTVLAGDSWDWHCASPTLRALELPGPHGCRALVQLPGSAGDPLRIIGWRPHQGGPLPAVLLLGAAWRLARRAGAGTLRVQPWPGQPGDLALHRACRLLGFVARDDFTTLFVRSKASELARAQAVVPTPLLYLGF